jgi:hypothetical protein
MFMEKRQIASVALFAALITPLYAQRDAASLEGRVVDASGR